MKALAAAPLYLLYKEIFLTLDCIERVLFTLDCILRVWHLVIKAQRDIFFLNKQLTLTWYHHDKSTKQEQEEEEEEEEKQKQTHVPSSGTESLAAADIEASSFSNVGIRRLRYAMRSSCFCLTSCSVLDTWR